ncbi:hypothetical protein AB0C12_03715 [Actinoplanes sp. NPDC048967]|uniref:hypothetical protein n=1 Tax=Actinoplanes sp. NPDC048967 TaxID=3155269 RepID=UPI0033D8707C
MASEAQQVSDEMARRARQNIDVIVARLVSEGYRFDSNDDKQAPVVRAPEPGRR